MDNIRLYTCMVGKKPTHANFYVNEVAEVEQTLSRMAGTSAEEAPPLPAGAIAGAAGRRGGDSTGSPRLEGVGGGGSTQELRLEPPTEV